MTKLSKISLGFSILIMLVFLTTQSLLVFNFIKYVDEIGYFGYACFLAFLPFFGVVVLEYIKKNKIGKDKIKYAQKLNETLISQSQNSLFYEGDITQGAKELTKEVSDSLNADRCSIWLYNEDRTSIICQQLYIKSEDTWYQNIELFKKDYKPYFFALLLNPIIIADDAETHQATSCFTESYLKPLGVKSMLDVPIMYKGETIGVICIESLTSSGKDHNIVNSGYHPKSYWKKMYNTIIKERKIWNDVVTNVSKNGELYWVDSYIIAEFSPITDELEGFMSIRYDVTELIKKSNEIEKKNTYLEHAAKILRHDMHSGINTYIPRGVSSLERRLTDDDVKRLKIENPLKMIKEGLLHSQKVYRGVYEFTNLVKKDVVLEKTECNLKTILDGYLSTTSYKSQVIIDELINTEVNEPLFCTAIDNLIRNGLKYNDSDTKFVKIFMEKGNLVIQDNGRGLTQEDFNKLSKPYVRKEGQKESGSGLGLNICLAILSEHGFNVSCQKNNIGTKITIKLK